MKIIRLEARNIMRLRAVEIEPDDNMVIVGGKNGAGKTCLLNSIMYALGGKRVVCGKPLRAGQKKGKIVLDLGKYTITRTFTAGGGGTLSVVDADGNSHPNPQALLGDLFSDYTFDPLAFTRMNSQEQLATLQRMIGIDFSGQNISRQVNYDKRTLVNRDVKNLEAQLRTLPLAEDVPEQEVSITALADDLQHAQQVNADNDFRRQQVIGTQEAWRADEMRLDDLQSQIREMQKQEAKLKEDLAIREKAMEESRVAVNQLQDAETGPIRQQMENAEVNNLKVRRNQARSTCQDRLRDVQKESEDLTQQIEDVDASKKQMLAEAKFPVEGLSFDEEQVVYNGLPLDQASSAEQLRVSVAMGMAINPELRVLLIRDGSLLDKESLKLLREIVKSNDYQVWIEMVREDKGCSVVIEDGMVKGKDGA